MILRLLLTISIILSELSLTAQTNFELKEVKTDNIYTNIVQKNGKLYIGSDNGAIEIDEKSNKINQDKNLKGYLSIVNDKIVGNKVTEDNNLNDNKYNYLLPRQFEKSQSRISLYNNYLYIINNNTLFIYYKNNYSKSHDSLNVRSITHNIIGSYNGIFKNGSKLKYPSFTDGSIREFDNEYFICYGGLFRDSADQIYDYFNQKYGEVQIGNKHIGAARDIIKLKNGNYALTTNLGIYVINLQNYSVKPIIESKIKNEFYLAFTYDNKKENLNSFHYILDGKVFIYNAITNENALLFDTKQKSIIKDVFIVNSSNLYILFNDKLIKYTKNYTSNVFEETILIEGLNFCHNIKLFNNILCITTNVGTHFYDIKKNKTYLNAIPFETNRRSLTIINDTLKFATTNGIINLSENNLLELLDKLDNIPVKNFEIDSESKNYIILSLIIIIVSIIIIGIYFYKKKIIKDNHFKPLSNKELIEKYIYENINKVTIHSICDKFKLNPNQLYEILEHEKPGEFIRMHRMNLVRKYRREKKDEKFISEHTGFSESYLKKIY